MTGRTSKLAPASLAAVLTIFGAPGADAAAQQALERPNIVLILSDDEDVALHEFMPKTHALLHEQGATFDNAFVSYPFCGPSRASILRGQYAHNTQVLGNEPPWGGYEKFRGLGLEDSTIATWLQEAGYRTALIGKYLNRYVPAKDGVPPGWDEWYVAGNAHPSYDYVVNENGRIVTYDRRPEDYLTDAMAAQSRAVIEAAAAADEPFFLLVATYTPHSPATAAPRHEGLFADVALPRPPAFDELEVRDKPALVSELPPLAAAEVDQMARFYRKRLQSLQAIDDLVETIVRTLEATGELARTYIVYTSDNGFHLGEHRMPAGKNMPYEEDVRVPLVVRGPGVPAGARVAPMVVNIDLAPTFADIAGAARPEFVDGRSFLPLFEDPEHPWRQSFLIERRQLETQVINRSELAGQRLLDSSVFSALRMPDWTYVEHGTGEKELYDLRGDPHQLANVADEADPVLLKALSTLLLQLAHCAGEHCRALEDLPVGQ